MSSLVETLGSFQEMVGRIPPDRTIKLEGMLSQERKIAELVAEFDTINDKGDGNILCIINSEGGRPDQARILFQVFRTSRNCVIGLVEEKAHSAASLVLQGCHVRLARSDAKLLIHGPFWKDKRPIPLAHNTTLEDYLAVHAKRFKDFHPLIRDEQDVTLRYYQMRPSAFKSKASLSAFLDEDRMIDAREALKLGFLDGIVDSAP